MINLPDVTILSLDCTNRINNTIKSIEKSCEKISFGGVKILSHIKPSFLPEGMTFEKTPYIDNLDLYSYYMFFELANHFSTKYVLTVQDHGYIINPELWDYAWLNYDYIGAPWVYHPFLYICKETGEHVRVGNGGFSLRSKKICEAPKKYGMQLLSQMNGYNEDINICIYHRKQMLDLGMQYAPIDVARIFSYETSVPENYGIKTFGYHRNYPL